jgi:phage shock protein A
MWRRLSRVVRSFVGLFISMGENPEIILEQNIRDMNDQVPRMNESIAMVKANSPPCCKRRRPLQERYGRSHRQSQSRHLRPIATISPAASPCSSNR